MRTDTKYNERGEASHHRIVPPNFEAMSEAEQDQWYVRQINLTIDDAMVVGKPEAYLHALFVIKDYLWYLKK